MGNGVCNGMVGEDVDGLDHGHPSAGLTQGRRFVHPPRGQHALLQLNTDTDKNTVTSVAT